MVLSLKELHALSDDEVAALYDEAALRTSVGLNHWEGELERRGRERVLKSNAFIARTSLILAVVSTVASVVAIVIAVVR